MIVVVRMNVKHRRVVTGRVWQAQRLGMEQAMVMKRLCAAQDRRGLCQASVMLPCHAAGLSVETIGRR
jgi:hypothetical protein